MGKANSKLNPDIIAELQKATHCTERQGTLTGRVVDKKEILSWYDRSSPRMLQTGRHRAFQREYPSGVMTRDQFLAIYDTFFPFGDSSTFAGLLFRLYDEGGVGSITFREFLMALSVTTRGNMDEKVDWTFRRYDRDGDGRIGRTDMLTVVEAVYRMMGTLVQPEDDEDTPAKRADKIFRLMAPVRRAVWC